MKPLWRILLVAPEGWGKAVLMRFLAIHAAAGRDPWEPSTFIDPRRVLYIDVENAESSIVHQLRIANTLHGVNIIGEAADTMHIWHREGGIDLRQRRTQAELEAVLQKTRPEIVFAGPLYKLYRRRPNEDMEQAALEFVEVLDDLRVRYGFALMLEHHAPKASGGGYREMNPFGSSLFLRWPEFGITMEPQGNVQPTDTRYVMQLGRFRRDREIADWPDELIRGAPQSFTPWRARWNAGRGRALQ
jgi:replicative DNA helicase